MENGHLKVLLIEDDLNYAYLLKYMLAEDVGLDLVHEEYLQAGLDRLADGSFNLVLLDLSLPDSQGQDTFTTLRSRWPVVPVVVLTGTDDDVLASELVSKGAQDYLEKTSVGPQLLVRSMRYAIERHQILAQLEAARLRDHQASEMRFHTLIEATNDGMLVVDPQLRVRFANEAAHNILADAPDEVLRQVFPLSGEPGGATEVLVRPSSDESFTFEMKAVEIEWEGEEVALVTLHDVNERKKAEMAMVDLDRMKSEFIGAVSHELRTPLHSIRGFNKLMLEGKVTDPQVQQEFLTIAVKQSEHLNSLINDLIDVSSLEAGQFSVRKDPVPDLAELIHGMAQECFSLALEKNIAIVEEVTESLPAVEADRSRLGQVLLNLLNNAIKFSDDDGKVMITAAPEGDQVLFQVRDFGIGIPQEAIPCLFDRFYRVDNSSTRNTGGSGLGLYISRQIVEAHGGRIWAESQPDQGSTFSFTIPVTSLS